MQPAPLLTAALLALPAAALAQRAAFWGWHPALPIGQEPRGVLLGAAALENPPIAGAPSRQVLLVVLLLYEAAFLLAALLCRDTVQAILVGGFLGLTLFVALADYHHGVMPDCGTLGGTWLGLVAAAAHQSVLPLEDAAVGGALLWGLLSLLGTIQTVIGRAPALGAGDPRFAAMVAVWLGAPAAASMVAIGALAAWAHGRMRRLGPGAEIHLGPYFAASMPAAFILAKFLLN